MLTEVHIDLNVRVAGNQTRSGFEDVKGGPVPGVGDRVVVRESESDVIGFGQVTRVLDDARLIYLAVDWKSLVPEHYLTSSELLEQVRQVVDGLTLRVTEPRQTMTFAATTSHYDAVAPDSAQYLAMALTA
ncbi:hypothetical protein ACJH6H_18225 [Mycobacterium sp. SMC-21]|uniref:hypothetical protein n=1 Tax=Mycobacterium sp. SMC-21 TaxID=3381632 RepID=UPI003875AFA1